MKGETERSEPMGYRERPRASRRSLRAVGVVATVFGACRLALSPMLIGYLRNVHARQPAVPAPFLARKIAEAGVMVVLAAGLLVAGVACVRGRPVGRRLLGAWATAAIAYTTYCWAFDALETVGSISAVSAYYVAAAAVGALQRWIWDFQFPVLVAVLATLAGSDDDRAVA
jgi:hypothetical protein